MGEGDGRGLSTLLYASVGKSATRGSVRCPISLGSVVIK